MSRPKIIYTNEPETKFSDIEVGETFTYARVLFMKIKSIESRHDGEYNAIILSSGDSTYVMDDAYVTPVDVEIKVR